MLRLTKRSALIAVLASSLILPTVYAETGLDFYQQNKNRVDVNNKSADEQVKRYNSLYEDIKDKKNEQSFKLGLSGGSLTLTMYNQISYQFGEPVITDGVDNRIPITFNGQLLVSDLRATGEGWHLTLEAEPLTEVKKDGGVMPDGGWYRAPAGTILLTATPIVTSMNTGITEGMPYVYFYGRDREFAIDNGPVTVVSAGYGEGMGEWSVTLPANAIQVVFDENTLKQDLVNYPDRPTPYTTKLKWTLVSGPGSEQPLDEPYYTDEPIANYPKPEYPSDYSTGGYDTQTYYYNVDTGLGKYNGYTKDQIREMFNMFVQDGMSTDDAYDEVIKRTGLKQVDVFHALNT